jgi:hypothetical protein
VSNCKEFGEIGVGAGAVAGLGSLAASTVCVAAAPGCVIFAGVAAFGIGKIALGLFCAKFCGVL